MVSIDQSLCIGCNSCVKNCCMGVFVASEERGTAPAIHPRRRCIQCMHCAAGCPKKAIRFDEFPDYETQVYRDFPENELEQLIVRRRSIRHFQDTAPDKALLQHCMDLASYAPSGKNRREWRFTVVYGKEQVAALRDRCLALCAEFGEAPELPKLMAKGTDLITCGAPCMILLWSPDDALNPVLDPAVVMSQLELLLVQQGLGTCWGGYLRQVSDRFPEIRALLHIPEGCHLRCALMTGYAKNERYPNAIVHQAPEAYWLEDCGL